MVAVPALSRPPPNAEPMKPIPPVLVLFYPRELLAVNRRLRGLPALGLRDALRHAERLSIVR